MPNEQTGIKSKKAVTAAGRNVRPKAGAAHSPPARSLNVGRPRCRNWVLRVCMGVAAGRVGARVGVGVTLISLSILLLLKGRQAGPRDACAARQPLSERQRSPVEHGAVGLGLRLELRAGVLANGKRVRLCRKERGGAGSVRLG